MSEIGGGKSLILAGTDVIERPDSDDRQAVPLMRLLAQKISRGFAQRIGISGLEREILSQEIASLRSQ